MIRITAGEYRSRLLSAPPDDAVTRPYTQRVKESVFNLLRGWFDGARVLDLFAGVGTVGLEAVSRGADRVVMVERDRRIADYLRENVASLGCEDRVEIVQGDALTDTVLDRAPAPVDLVFVDPPYMIMEDEAGRERVLAFVSRLAPVCATPSYLVLRTSFGPDEHPLEIEGFEGPEPHQYSKSMWVMLYAPAPLVQSAS